MGVDTKNIVIILHFLDCVDFDLSSLIGNVKIVNRIFFWKVGIIRHDVHSLFQLYMDKICLELQKKLHEENRPLIQIYAHIFFKNGHGLQNFSF